MADGGGGVAAGDDTIEMDDTFSPQFVQEVNRTKTFIRNLVENNTTRDFFSKLSSNLGDVTALLRVQFTNMMGKMEEKEKQSMVKELIKMVHHVAEKNSPDRVFVGANYERVVDELFRHALKKEVISTTLCAEGLIMTTDFRLCSRICQEKWRFINECIPKIDYKGIRNILRYILESQLRRLPYELAPEQVNEVRIVENVILHIVDRDSNLMPPLITLSEIMRGMPKQAHMLPRLTEKLANLSVHFRPIADLTHVCGRSFVYPIPLHPAFFPQTPFWEDFGLNVPNSFVQSHHTLPYRPEHTASFLYTLYMILRQPMGKDSLQPPNKTKTKSHWDLLISIMICESMAETESLAENEPIPRYQWDNIVNLVIYGMQHHLLNPKNFFRVLKGLIKQCKYTRARDEVMWIVFQVVGSLSNVTRLEDSVQEIVDLYQELFDGDVPARAHG
uniref:Mediator of RNA polymerase II transcription subunit 23 n=1 Tax=Caenorhabditis tropicalis TaxID=1561998 RepID=A0A1I7UZR4_9PELO